MMRVRSIDPELAALSVLVPNLDLSDPVAARADEIAVATELNKSTRAQDYEPFDVPRDDGSNIQISIHRPVGRRNASPPLPVLVFLHGGSFILGGIHSELERCAQYADGATCAVVSVEYLLAPEHPYPAGLTDCLTVLAWLAANHQILGIDPHRVALGGLSAGGALAAASALCLLDARAGNLPAEFKLRDTADLVSLRIVLQMLLFPVLDASLSTRSSDLFTDTPVLNAEALPLLWNAYAGAAAPTRWMAPALAESLEGSPPTYIACAQYDPLRDEALEFAKRLLSADVPVDLRLYAGTYHSFDAFHTTRIGRLARQQQIEALSNAFRYAEQAPNVSADTEAGTFSSDAAP